MRVKEERFVESFVEYRIDNISASGRSYCQIRCFTK